MTAHGLPDNQKSSRIMLKDYVKVCGAVLVSCINYGFFLIDGACFQGIRKSALESICFSDILLTQSKMLYR